MLFRLLVGMTLITSCTAVAMTAECVCTTRGTWNVVETQNFQIWSKLSKKETISLANRCEDLRTDVSQFWNCPLIEPSWSPKCVIAVHSNQREYNHFLGNPHERSVGCTTVTCDGGRVVFRRIDLRNDAADWKSNALPHELTHVVLADAFVDHSLPHWLNEGMAMVFETEDLQARRSELLEEARLSDELPDLKHVIHGMPGQNLDLGYAISHSLVQYLHTRGEPEKLIDFAREISSLGYDGALEKTYALQDGMSQLEREWHVHLERRNPEHSQIDAITAR